uniref:Uncharacterized protein n=1 Tax=Anguilla anguilla TaxID=7936 RepID=A0A0E9WLC6_ANGAN
MVKSLVDSHIVSNSFHIIVSYNHGLIICASFAMRFNDCMLSLIRRQPEVVLLKLTLRLN